ncbi:MAG: SatD family protein [Clostridiales bacterium]|nr:SatD family protein [Clostridiales bacterium]
MYYALIGDLIGSKKLNAEQRHEAQEKLRAALELVNREFEKGVASKFLITIGDECQGLMEPWGDPVAAALLVIHEMRPYRIRFAIGAGEISTAIDPAAAIGADGPAYHLARRRVESMKSDHVARLRVALGDAALEESLNTVLALCDRVANYRTDKQEKLCFQMLMASFFGRKLTQTTLAERNGIGQSTVNAQLNAAGSSEHCDGMLFVRDSLSKYMNGRA